MKYRGLALLLPLLAVSSLAQDADRRCCDGKGHIADWKEYNKDFEWIVPVSKARQKAQDEGKILMVVRLAGDMNKEGI